MFECYNDFYKDYYQGYELNDGVFSYELTDMDKRVLDNAILMIDNKLSLRKLSKEVMLGKSQLDYDINIKLKKLSYELYRVVKRLMFENKKKYFRYP